MVMTPNSRRTQVRAGAMQMQVSGSRKASTNLKCKCKKVSGVHSCVCEELMSVLMRVLREDEPVCARGLDDERGRRPLE